ncbi:MAG: pyridoxal 5'-phosphate synthase glutaminase subunit PdxT [Spirochaetaceae bacterium]|nr:pyridoxal 5'-phosphate synthase glutaminase subunit PdxT [Spirochaetaceae bacterium]
MKKIGVLALQGDYAAHMAALAEAGAAPFEVRSRADLDKAEAMVIPGGESTVMGSLLERFGFMGDFRQRILEGMPVFGTCAGLILLAKEIEGENAAGGTPARSRAAQEKARRRQALLAVLDVTVRRNAYGTQIDSFRAPLATSVPGIPEIEGVFIRAPKVVRLGPGVEVLARQGKDPVLVRQGSILAATFHPELVPGAGIHSFFISLVR